MQIWTSENLTASHCDSGKDFSANCGQLDQDGWKRIGDCLPSPLLCVECSLSTHQPVQEDSKELSGLQAKLDKLVHHKEKSAVQGAHLHAFIYFVTIRNLTESTVTLLGRKWILVNEDGTTTVVEGDKIVGECPVLEPGRFLFLQQLSCHPPLRGGPRIFSRGGSSMAKKVHVRMDPFRLGGPH